MARKCKHSVWESPLGSRETYCVSCGKLMGEYKWDPNEVQTLPNGVSWRGWSTFVPVDEKTRKEIGYPS